MNCKEAEKLILPYILKELSDELTVPFIEHVRSCSACYDEFEIYYTIRHMLQSDDAVTAGEGSFAGEESYDIRQMIEADFENRLNEVRKAKRRKKAAYAGVVLGVIVLAALVIAAVYPDEVVRVLYSAFKFLTDWGIGEG